MWQVAYSWRKNAHWEHLLLQSLTKIQSLLVSAYSGSYVTYAFLKRWVATSTTNTVPKIFFSVVNMVMVFTVSMGRGFWYTLQKRSGFLRPVTCLLQRIEFERIPLRGSLPRRSSTRWMTNLEIHIRRINLSKI